MIRLYFGTLITEKRGINLKNNKNWVENHKYLALFVFAGVPFVVAQGIKLLLIASFREAITQVIKGL